MRNLVLGLATALALPAVASAADYTVITRQVDVARPADAVWAKVGDFCGGISAFLKVQCSYGVGTGDVGTVRKLTGGTEELMTARWAHGYAYQQTAGNLAAMDYHASVQVMPSADGKTSKVVYVLIYDSAALPAERKAGMETTLTRVFQGAVDNIKTIAEAN